MLYKRMLKLEHTLKENLSNKMKPQPERYSISLVEVL